jgi:hypothetical protein
MYSLRRALQSPRAPLGAIVQEGMDGFDASLKVRHLGS